VGRAGGQGGVFHESTLYGDCSCVGESPMFTYGARPGPSQVRNSQVASTDIFEACPAASRSHVHCSCLNQLEVFILYFHVDCITLQNSWTSNYALFLRCINEFNRLIFLDTYIFLMQLVVSVVGVNLLWEENIVGLLVSTGWLVADRSISKSLPNFTWQILCFDNF
jgi:hypothetical protein